MFVDDEWHSTSYKNCPARTLLARFDINNISFNKNTIEL